jgi:hypothetical protein
MVGCGVVEDVVGCGLGCCTQLASFVLPSVAEDLPATQSKQLLAPGAAEYLPAVQSVHAPTTVHSAEKPSYSKK